jgi:hypothetical protein
MFEMGPRIEEKKHLSAKGLLNKIQNFFCTIKNPVKGAGSGKAKISLADCLMSGLAIFGLKMPSLLQFDLRKNEENVKHNLKTLYQVEETPCDTYLRERLDNLDPQEIRGAFTSVFSSLQRGKVLEKYEFIDKHYLLLCDGTGFFSSKQVHCKNCCEKKHKNGTTTYHHMMLGAAIAHPNYPEVIPLCPEPIQKKDGSKKNDCERNACKRFLTDLRREHPHLPLILAEDGLSANAPHLRLCKEHNIRFISVVKKEGNKTLFEWIKNINSSEKIIYDKNGKMIHKIRFYNGIPLNNADPDFEVNFLEYWEYNSQGEEIYYNTWVTDIEIIEANALEICRGGRARWKIESAPQAHKERGFVMN